MIRRMEAGDARRVAEIWLSANLEAHGFVPEEYWRENAPEVERQLIEAEVYVYEQEGELRGFVGMQGEYLAGIFVESRFRSLGVGRALLEHVKKIHPAISLRVYQKNRRAAAFYLREGFTVASEGVDESTGEPEFVMAWARS